MTTRVLQRAASIVKEADELTREVMLLKGLDTGRFNVALALFPAELSGSRAVGKLIRDHPKIECHVNLCDWEHVAQQVLSGDVDIGMGELSAATPLQIEPWLETGELAVIPFHKPWMKLDYGFLYRKDRMLSPTAEQFMDNVRRIEKELASRNRELMRTLFPDK